MLSGPGDPKMLSGPGDRAAGAVGAHPEAASDSYARQAVSVVSSRLLDAVYREGLAPTPADLIRHGFGRVEVGPQTRTPGEILDAYGITAYGLRTELDDAVANLAVAFARRADIDQAWRKLAAEHGISDAYGLVTGLDADEQALAFEQLSTEGHNLHPCGRTRLGWNLDDLLAYDQESPYALVRFLAIRRDCHVGEDIGALLRDAYSRIPEADDGYALQPVHPWQLRLVRERYADAFADGRLREVGDVAVDAAPTTALRTLLVEPDADGIRRYLKLSLDIQVTSTRRSISVATTRNGPVISRLLTRLITDERVQILPEIAGAAMTGVRDLAAIVRSGLGGAGTRRHAREVAIPASALPAMSPITGRTILTDTVERSGLTAMNFLDAYARLVLPQALVLLDAGIGLEAHLQNSIPIFVDGVPRRIAFRDCGGLRVNVARLSARSMQLDLWPGSVIATNDQDVVRAKLGYTALQAHLGEVILRLGDSHGLDEVAAWRRVRAVILAVYEGLDLDQGDRDFLLAPQMPHKALTRMRIVDSGDMYVCVPNPLHADA
jgi:D-ornithine---citrate ligase